MYVCNARTYVCLGETVFSCHSLHLFISYKFNTNETEKKIRIEILQPT
jgi:hypothetical protein